MKSVFVVPFAVKIDLKNELELSVWEMVVEMAVKMNIFTLV